MILPALILAFMAQAAPTPSPTPVVSNFPLSNAVHYKCKEARGGLLILECIDCPDKEPPLIMFSCVNCECGPEK